MQCMKCGRDLEAGEVFCSECRQVMEKYPVKPGTVVQLPYRSAEAAAKKQQPRRRKFSPEEQISLLRRLTRTLALALVACMLACLGLGYFAVTQYLENRDKQAVGQNYYVVSPTASAPEVPVGLVPAGQAE